MDGQAARREGRGPPARVRRLRGDHPAGELRRRRGDRVGPRRVGPARGLARGAREGEAALRAQGLQAPRQVDAREDQEERARLAAHQGARRLGEVARRSVPRGVGAVRAHRRRGEGRHAPRQPARGSGRARRRAARARRRAHAATHARRTSRRRRSHAMAGCSSSSSTAIGSSPPRRAARRFCSRGTATTTRRCFRRSPARSRRFPFDECILDGEVVVLDAQGKPSFSRLQQRGRLQSPLDIRRAAVELPATYYAFDLLALRGLRSAPAAARRRASSCSPRRCRSSAPCALLDHIEREGDAFLAQVAAIGLEGIIAKRADAPVPRRSHGRVAQDQGRDDGRLRHRRLHGAKGDAQPHRRAAARRLSWAARSSTRAEWARDSTRRRSVSCPSMLEPIVRADAAVPGPLPNGTPHATMIPETKTTTWVEPRARRARCASANGRRMACCDMRRSCACAPTRTRATASASERLLSSRTSADDLSSRASDASVGLLSGQRPATMPGAIRRALLRSAVRDDDRRSPSPDDHLLQPEEDLLARRAVHEGRHGRVLSRRSSPWMLAVPAQPPASCSRASPTASTASRSTRRTRRSSRRNGCASMPHLERGHAARRSATSCATTSSRCSTSPTWAPSRCTSGRAESDRSSSPTGA